MAAFRSIVEFHLDPDRLDDGIAALRAGLKQTRDFDGCTELDLVQDEHDDARLFALVGWESREKESDYRQWRASGKTPEVLALAEYLVGPMGKCYGPTI